jgi:hypothetical protein
MLLHSLGSAPLTLVPESHLQAGKVHTSETRRKCLLASSVCDCYVQLHGQQS